VEITVIKVDISCFYHSQFVSAKVSQLYYDDSTDLLRFCYKIKDICRIEQKVIFLCL
jgi:hypothetical protein